MNSTILFMRPLPSRRSLRTTLKTRGYPDHAPSWYDTHTRVFYIYALGRYMNQRLYCYGETIDLEAVEFHLAKTLPIYERVLFAPAPIPDVHSKIALCANTVVRGVRGLEDWNIFTCDDIDACVAAIERDIKNAADLD